MSASVGIAQQPLSIGIGRLGSAFAALVVAVIIAAAVAFGQLGAIAKPLAPVGGFQNPDAVDQGMHSTTTGTQSFGGWNGPRGTAGGGIDDVDHGARDGASGTGGSNGPRLRAQ